MAFKENLSGSWPGLIAQLLVILYEIEMFADLAAKRREVIIKENITAMWEKQWKNKNKGNQNFSLQKKLMIKYHHLLHI